MGHWQPVTTRTKNPARNQADRPRGGHPKIESPEPTTKDSKNYRNYLANKGTYFQPEAYIGDLREPGGAEGIQQGSREDEFQPSSTGSVAAATTTSAQMESKENRSSFIATVHQKGFQGDHDRDPYKIIGAHNNISARVVNTTTYNLQVALGSYQYDNSRPQLNTSQVIGGTPKREITPLQDPLTQQTKQSTKTTLDFGLPVYLTKQL